MAAEHVEQKLEDFRTEVREQFNRVGDELKELTQALRDLIRIDGDIRRLREAIKRIGGQVDDHEKRLRSAERAGTASHTETKQHDRLLWLIVVASSNVLTGFIVYAITRTPT